MAAHIRVTQIAAETVAEDVASAHVRVTQIAAETVTEDVASAHIRVTQIAAETVTADVASAHVRVTPIVVEGDVESSAGTAGETGPAALISGSGSVPVPSTGT